ncbi:unnamed protein product [Lampetra planeri]
MRPRGSTQEDLGQADRARLPSRSKGVKVQYPNAIVPMPVASVSFFVMSFDHFLQFIANVGESEIVVAATVSSYFSNQAALESRSRISEYLVRPGDRGGSDAGVMSVVSLQVAVSLLKLVDEEVPMRVE